MQIVCYSMDELETLKKILVPPAGCDGWTVIWGYEFPVYEGPEYVIGLVGYKGSLQGECQFVKETEITLAVCDENGYSLDREGKPIGFAEPD